MNMADFTSPTRASSGGHTYAGGVDKLAHFVDYNLAQVALANTYRRIGYASGQSGWIGFATSVAAGLATEIGDGTTYFGFSWEDFLADALGAATAMGLSRSGWNDTIGFRFGTFSQDPAPSCCIRPHERRKGLLRRDLHRRPQDRGARAQAQAQPGARAVPPPVGDLRNQRLQTRRAGAPPASGRPGDRRELLGDLSQPRCPERAALGRGFLLLLRQLPHPLHGDRRPLRREQPRVVWSDRRPHPFPRPGRLPVTAASRAISRLGRGRGARAGIRRSRRSCRSRPSDAKVPIRSAPAVSGPPNVRSGSLRPVAMSSRSARTGI